jgi:hypothetical protein
MYLGLGTIFFCRNVPWVSTEPLCWHGSEILNIFRTGSEKPQKLAKPLKVPQGSSRQLPVTDILLLRAVMLLRVRRYEKSQFQW